MSGLSVEELKRVLSYDPDTGKFHWLVSLTRSVAVGDVAGGPSSDGYLRIGLHGVRYMAHRLAWFYMMGRWPADDIDHINGSKTDNRFANLREATRRMNAENQRRARKDSSVGLLGVGWHKRDKHFRAQIQVRGKHVFLGYFPTAEEAHQAYLAAKRKYHEGGTL